MRRTHPASYYSNVTTLAGMSLKERAQFSYDNVQRFFKVTLWGDTKNRRCPGCYKMILSFDHATTPRRGIKRLETHQQFNSPLA